MYKLEERLLPKGHRLRPGGDYKNTTVTIHSTGNLSSSPRSERNWLNNSTNNRLAAWHYVIGDGLVVQAIPENETAWHCGHPTGNNYSIGIEIVESGDRCKVLMTAAEFVADVLKAHGWGTEKIRTHYSWTTKNCPRILIDPAHVKGNMNWNWFIKTVEAFLGDDETMKPVENKIKINGQVKKALCVNIDGYTYWKIRDIAPDMGYNVTSEGKVPVLTKKE